MVMLKVFRPICGLIGKRSIVNVQSTKARYFAHDALQAAASCNSVEEFLQKHEITIHGKNTENFRPILNFEETGFPDSVVGALKSKFDAPSVIQSISWPPVLAGRDLVGIARTGSGKTLGFLLPAIVHISKQEPLKRGDGPMVLILCPTRELAQQVQAVANEWGDMLTKVRTMCAYGGTNRGPQELLLHRGVEIVVATPGRLNDFLQTRSTNLRRCTYVVLDEADRMLDMGFEPQIRHIIDHISKERQTLMFSATWPNEVRLLASDFMKDYVHIKVGSASLSANKNITQIVHVTTQADRDKEFWNLLKQLLEQDQNAKILVFSLQKASASRMEYRAQDKGISASSIHGDKSQAFRDRTLREFRSGKTQVLFATDVAARGLDVDDINYVINYDHPFCAEDYVHRIGRTARRDLKGESHTFLTEEDAGDRAKDLIKVLEASEQPVPEELRKLAARQIFSSKKAIRRWGSSGGNTSGPFGGNIFGKDRYGSFSDRRHDRYDRGSRNRYDKYNDEEDEFVDRRDYNSQSRYSNYGNRQQQQRQRYAPRNDGFKDDFDDLEATVSRGNRK